MPNKFFEYIQSKLCIVCGIQNEMGKYIEKYDMGINVGSNDPKVLADRIKSLNLKQINQHKMNVSNASKHINSEYTKQIFLNSLKNKILPIND